MANNALNRARWRSVMAMQSFVTDVAQFNINPQNVLQAVNARNQFMNIERYFNENKSLGTKLWESLFGNGGFFSNQTFNDPGNEFQIHIEKLREQINIVIINNAICRQQLQLRIDNNNDPNTGISAQQFHDGGAGGLQQGQSYAISKEACFDAIESIRAINLDFLDYIGDNVAAAAQASRSIEEVLYFNSADISPFTAILHRLLNDQRQIVNAEHAQNLRDTLNSWMMFFEIPISDRLDLFGTILSNPLGIDSDQVIAELQDKIRGFAMNSRTILNHNGFNGANVIPLVIDGINPYQHAWRLMGEAVANGIMRSDDPGVPEDFDNPNQPLRPKTALYCTLISFLTSGPSIVVRLRLLEKHFAELVSSTQNGNGFVPIGGGDNPVQLPAAAVSRFARFKKHMVRINALSRAALNDPNIPVNHFRKNLSMCFETMFPSIIEGGNANATFEERKEALEQVEDPDYVQPLWADAESSEEESDGSSGESGGSGMDVESEEEKYGGGRRKKRKKTRRKRKRKRKKTKRKKRKKTKRKKTKRRRKTRRRK
jgi:hypothetical protein